MKGGSLSIIPKSWPELTGAVVMIYDLSDPEAWERTGPERGAWGRERAEIRRLDNDVVVVEFKPGGALEASA